MRYLKFRGRPALFLAALALAGASGCEEKHQPPGTNASTGPITEEGPGTKVLAGQQSDAGENPKKLTGEAPPVSPMPGVGTSGEANSGRKTGQASGAGSDASTEGAKPIPSPSPSTTPPG